MLSQRGRLGLAAELPRRHALEFLEQHEEVFGVFHADLPRDAFDGLVGLQQQTAGLVHAKLVELIADGNARLRQILLAQIGGGNAHLLGDGLRADARVAETLLQPLVVRLCFWAFCWLSSFSSRGSKRALTSSGVCAAASSFSSVGRAAESPGSALSSR